MTTPLRPDVEFALAALRRDAGAARAQRAAAARVPDWDAVARFAAAHAIEWWVARALPAAGVPDDVRNLLQDAVRGVALSSMAGARQLTELTRVLAGADVRAVAYKGPALSADVHGDPGARRFADLDLLIAESDRVRALEVLHAAGYASPSGYSERAERVYSRWEGVAQLTRDDDFPVELHWRCQAPRYGGPQDPAPVVSRARWCALGGGRVLAPSPEDLGVLLALHGVKHAWTSLLWMADFVAAVRRPGFDWPLFAARADEWHVRRAVHYALLAAQELTALEMPPALLRTAGADARAAALARAVSAQLTQAAGAPAPWTESTPRYDLQWLEGAWARARYLALAAALPTPRERNAAPLPDALLPLAYPLRVLRALRLAGRAIWGRA
ncbi:MAG: nucleotidyltransferase domain-containing protein [Gemmatimonadaceae bacterium]